MTCSDRCPKNFALFCEFIELWCNSRPSHCLFACLFVCLFVCLCVYLFVCVSCHEPRVGYQNHKDKDTSKVKQKSAARRLHYSPFFHIKPRSQHTWATAATTKHRKAPKVNGPLKRQALPQITWCKENQQLCVRKNEKGEMMINHWYLLILQSSPLITDSVFHICHNFGTGDALRLRVWLSVVMESHCILNVIQKKNKNKISEDHVTAEVPDARLWLHSQPQDEKWLLVGKAHLEEKNHLQKQNSLSTSTFNPFQTNISDLPTVTHSTL